jgi:hypothetical protein
VGRKRLPDLRGGRRLDLQQPHVDGYLPSMVHLVSDVKIGTAPTSVRLRPPEIFHHSSCLRLFIVAIVSQVPPQESTPVWPRLFLR